MADEQELPYAELVMEGGAVVGVRCPVCGEVLLTTNPLTAGEMYGRHYHDKHKDHDGNQEE